MPGTFDSLSRKLTLSVLPVWMGDLDNVLVAGSDVGKFTVPFNCQVVRVILNVPGGTASSQLIMEVFRGGGVGVGSAIVTSPQVFVAAGGATGATSCSVDLRVPLECGEVLNIVARADDADTDDFTDVAFQLVVQSVMDENVA
jgi:hypothetical protein